MKTTVVVISACLCAAIGVSVIAVVLSNDRYRQTRICQLQNELNVVVAQLDQAERLRDNMENDFQRRLTTAAPGDIHLVERPNMDRVLDDIAALGQRRLDILQALWRLKGER